MKIEKTQKVIRYTKQANSNSIARINSFQISAIDSDDDGFGFSMIARIRGDSEMPENYEGKHKVAGGSEEAILAAEHHLDTIFPTDQVWEKSTNPS